MEPTRITESDPLWKSILTQARGFGMCRVFFEVFSDTSLGFCRRDFESREKTVLLTPRACMLPSRTSFREVSGRNSVRATRVTPERIARNQNIHLQPSFSAMIPARTGPKLGAVHVLVKDETKGTKKLSGLIKKRYVQENQDPYVRTSFPWGCYVRYDAICNRVCA